MGDELPIVAVKAEVVAALRGPAPVIVAAPTGSGKSTTLPGWAAEVLGGRVLVVEPRRVACRALAGWVAQGRGEEVGASVGYQVRFDRRGGPDTQIWFVTPGVALNALSETRDALDYAAVIVDEYHERSWEIDLLVALLRARVDRGRAAKVPTPALVLCSATLDLAALQTALAATVVTGEGRTFPVDIRHDGEGGPSDRDLDARIFEAVNAALDGRRGDVLVFLPGKREIEDARTRLRDSPAVARAEAEIVVVHGALPPDRLARAFAGSSRRRVFLSTNVAETSLTLPGVRTVVDSGLARMRIHRGGHSVLAIAPISQASADQRAGRAGRVAAGTCVRLWHAAHELRPTTAPEIGRVELDDLVLRAAQCGLWGDALATAPWVEPPPIFALERATARLRHTGALDDEGRPTPQGHVQLRTPVSADRSRLFVGVADELRADVADVVALLEVGRDLVLPSDADEAIEVARRALFAGAHDEVEVAVRALRAGDPRRHGLHRAALAEARRLAAALRQSVGAPPGVAGSAKSIEFRREALTAHLAARVPEMAFARRERADRKKARGEVRRGPISEPWGNGETELALRPYAIPGHGLDAQPPPPRAGFVLEQIWLGAGGRGARGVGRLLFAVEPVRLAALGIGETHTAEPRLSRTRAGRLEVEARVRTQLGGTTLDERSQPLRGAALRSVLADLFMAGRIRPTVGERVLQAVHHWHLVAVAYEGVPPAPAAPKAWLAQRLETLGLEGPADLELLDDDDLVPDPEALVRELGLDQREAEALRRDFPRTWTHADARYVCHVDLERRRVTLEPDNKRARSVNEPPAQLLPRFRGFGVAYQKASRRVKLR